jgi:mannose-6-phosphate isomerase-like protein (cupin superfamily)
MIRKGDILENPVTGERVLFRQTSYDTGGELVEIEVEVQPDGFGAARHVHPYQSETFRILEGEVGFDRGGEKLVARSGDVVLVEAGTAHKFWNTGDGLARFVAEVRPALQFEQLLETMYGLAADGRTNRKGMPNPLRLAVVAREHFDDVRLPFPPAWMQRMGLSVGAPLGRALGYRPVYVPAAEPALTLQPA